MSKMIRVSDEVFARLTWLAHKQEKSVQEILNILLDAREQREERRLR